MLQKSGRLVLWEAMFILELHSAETQVKILLLAGAASGSILPARADGILPASYHEASVPSPPDPQTCRQTALRSPVQ